MTDRQPTETRPARMEPLARLPVFLALDGKRAVLAGGSAAAAWKAELLSAAGAQVEVYAEEVSRRAVAGCRRSAARGRSTIHRRAFTPGDLAGAAIAIGAFEDNDAAAAFAATARAAGVPVNVIDKPALLRLFLRRHRQSFAAGDRHFHRRRGAGVRAGDPRQARGAAAARLRRLGRGGAALARRRCRRQACRSPAAASSGSCSPRTR